jgi:hypothetical protein
MSHTTKILVLVAMLLGLAICSGICHAQCFDPRDEQQIREFKLTNSYLFRYKTMLDQDLRMPFTPMVSRTDMRAAPISLAGLARELSQDARENESLKKSGLRPIDAVVGTIVLVRAGLLDARGYGLQGVDGREADTVDPANLTFYRTHKIQIQMMWRSF